MKLLINNNKKIRTKHEILNFLYELATSSDPFILAGFGTENQKKIMNSKLDIFDFIANWINESNKDALLNSIIDILTKNKLDKNCEYAKTYFKEDWDMTLEDVITKICENDKKLLTKTIVKLEKYTYTKELAKELELY